MAAAAGAASSIFSPTTPRRLPFAPTPAPVRKPLAAAAPKALTVSSQKPQRLPCPPSSCAPAPPPSPPEGTEKPDPIKLAFARAAAYKKERDTPSPPPAPLPTPPTAPTLPSQPQASAGESGSKEAFQRALEYRNGNGTGVRAGGGEAPLLGGSLDFGQNALLSEDVMFGKKGEYVFDETDFLGLDFFEKKRYKGPPPGLAPAFEPLTNDDFPEVEIIVGDPSKFEKSQLSTEIQPVDDKESKDSQSTSDMNEANKVEKAPPSTVIEQEQDEDDVYRPTVRSWGMFPRPQNISKAALREGDEMMNTGRLKQALPYYEKVMNAVDFKAMDFMKVNSTPVPKNTGYETYFTKFSGQKNYYASLDEPEVGLEQIIPYMLFLVSPIFIVAFVALRKSFQL
nr:unnamed protein product [Digitaria exilis]